MLVRRFSALLILALVVAACGGGDSEGGATTTAGAGASDSTASAGASDSTGAGASNSTGATAAGGGSGSGECPVGGSELSAAFPGGVPDTEVTEGANGETICTWNTGTGNLIVSVWPGEEFFSECEPCTPLDLGEQGWMDGTPMFWTALVVEGGETVGLTASSLDLEESVFYDLVRQAVGS